MTLTRQQSADTKQASAPQPLSLIPKLLTRSPYTAILATKPETLVSEGINHTHHRAISVAMHYFLYAAIQRSEAACKAMTAHSENLNIIRMTCQLELAAHYSGDPRFKARIGNVLHESIPFFINDYDQLMPMFPERAIELAVFTEELGYKATTNTLAELKKKFPAEYKFVTDAKQKIQRLLDNKDLTQQPDLCELGSTYHFMKHNRFLHRYRHQLIQKLKALTERNKDPQYFALLANIYLKEATVVDTWNDYEALLHYQAAAYYFKCAGNNKAAHDTLFLYAVELQRQESSGGDQIKLIDHSSHQLLLELSKLELLNAKVALISYHSTIASFSALTSLLAQASKENNINAAQKIIRVICTTDLRKNLISNPSAIQANLAIICALPQQEFQNVFDVLTESKQFAIRNQLATLAIRNALVVAQNEWKDAEVNKQYHMLPNIFDSLSYYTEKLECSLPAARAGVEKMEQQLISLYQARILTDRDLNPIHTILNRAGTYAKMLYASACQKNRLWAMTKQFQYHQQKKQCARMLLGDKNCVTSGY